MDSHFQGGGHSSPSVVRPSVAGRARTCSLARVSADRQRAARENTTAREFHNLYIHMPPADLQLVSRAAIRQAASLRAVADLCKAATGTVAVEMGHFIPMLASMMSVGPEAAEAIIHLCEADPINKDACREMGIIPLLTAQLRHAKSATRAARVLTTVCSMNEPNQVAAVESGCLLWLMVMLRSEEPRPALAELADCTFLCRPQTLDCSWQPPGLITFLDRLASSLDRFSSPPIGPMLLHVRISPKHTEFAAAVAGYLGSTGFLYTMIVETGDDDAVLRELLAEASPKLNELTKVVIRPHPHEPPYRADSSGPQTSAASAASAASIASSVSATSATIAATFRSSSSILRISDLVEVIPFAGDLNGQHIANHSDAVHNLMLDMGVGGMRVEPRLGNAHDVVKAADDELMAAQEPFMRLHPELPQLLRLIHKHKKQFHTPPLGPVGLHVKVRPEHRQLAAAAEVAMGESFLLTFAVHQSGDGKSATEDEQLLRQLVGQVEGRNGRVSRLGAAIRVPMRNFGQARHTPSGGNSGGDGGGGVSLLDAVEVTSSQGAEADVFFNLLLDDRNAEKTMLFTSVTEAEEAIYRAAGNATGIVRPGYDAPARRIMKRGKTMANEYAGRPRMMLTASPEEENISTAQLAQLVAAKPASCCYVEKDDGSKTLRAGILTSKRPGVAMTVYDRMPPGFFSMTTKLHSVTQLKLASDVDMRAAAASALAEIKGKETNEDSSELEQHKCDCIPALMELLHLDGAACHSAVRCLYSLAVSSDNCVDAICDAMASEGTTLACLLKNAVSTTPQESANIALLASHLVKNALSHAQLTRSLSTVTVGDGIVPPLVALLQGGATSDAAQHAEHALWSFCQARPKEVLLAVHASDESCSLVAPGGSASSEFLRLFNALVPEALKHIMGCIDDPAADVQMMQDAIDMAKRFEVMSVESVDPNLMRRADDRLRELVQQEAVRARRESLGVGAIPCPDEFVCPITYDKMVHPVVASDGHSYERSAIQEFLDRHAREGTEAKSPITREALSTTLFANHNLRKRIREHDEDLLQVAEAAGAAGEERGCRLSFGS